MKLHFVCCILEFIGKIRQHKYWLIGVLVVSTLASLIAAKFIFSQTLTSYQDGDGNIYGCSQSIKARKGTETAFLGHEQGLVPANKADADKYCHWVGIE